LPVGPIVLFNNTTMLGQATTKGKILINENFINLTCIDLLINTIRHELAHLIVGLQQNHNKHFKRVALLLGVKNNSYFDLGPIQNKIGFKYEVSATLESGEVILIGGVHRKTKRYIDYISTNKKWHSINGDKVIQYHFKQL
jgi:hypothetical protein